MARKYRHTCDSKCGHKSAAARQRGKTYIGIAQAGRRIFTPELLQQFLAWKGSNCAFAGCSTPLSPRRQNRYNLCTYHAVRLAHSLSERELLSGNAERKSPYTAELERRLEDESATSCVFPNCGGELNPRRVALRNLCDRCYRNYSVRRSYFRKRGGTAPQMKPPLALYQGYNPALFGREHRYSPAMVKKFLSWTGETCAFPECEEALSANRKNLYNLCAEHSRDFSQARREARRRASLEAKGRAGNGEAARVNAA